MQLYGFTSLYHLQKTNQQIKKQKKQTKIKHPHNSCDLFSDRYFQSLLFPVSSVHFIALASSPGKMFIFIAQFWGTWRRTHGKRWLNDGSSQVKTNHIISVKEQKMSRGTEVASKYKLLSQMCGWMTHCRFLMQTTDTFNLILFIWGKKRFNGKS